MCRISTVGYSQSHCRIAVAAAVASSQCAQPAAPAGVTAAPRSTELHRRAVDRDALGAHLLLVGPVRIADDGRLGTHAELRRRKAAALHPRWRRQDDEPDFPGHLETHVTVRMFVAGFLDGARQGELFRGVVAAPAVMRGSGSGNGREHDEREARTAPHLRVLYRVAP